MLSELQGCVFDTWSPGIGDPSIGGWITVAGYILATLLTALVYWRRITRHQMFWFLLTVLLGLLALNKQLDLQSALTAIGRCVAQAQGWYEDRRIVQLGFILAVGLIGLVATISIAWSLRRGLSQIWLALLGFAFLVTFVVIRAAGFHHVDHMIGTEFAGLRINWVLELSGIIMISLNALWLLRRGRTVYEDWTMTR